VRLRPGSARTYSPGVAGERPETRDRRWLLALLAICAVGLAIRVGYVVGWRDVDAIQGDPRYYHEAANLLAEGEGFIHPFAYDEGIRVPGADHPPGYAVVLAVPSLVGLDSIRAHQLASCLIGTGTIALVGLLARRLGGGGAGLLAAALAAVYPNLWFNDGALMSETLALFLGVVVTLLAYRAWDRPDWRRFALLGAAIGLASLARAEAAMLVVLLLVPLAIWVPSLTGWRPRLAHGALAGATALLVMAPWVVANLVRFEHPATLSTQMGPTLEVGNCDQTYHEPFLGAWSFGCASTVAVEDRSVLDQVTRDHALTFIGDHLDRVPVVVAARLGRTWAVYSPLRQLDFDYFAETRPLPAARLGLALYYGLAVAAVVGIVGLRRRGVPSFPLTVWLVNVAVTVVVFYGSTRFRAPAEPALVVLAAVGVTWLVDRRRRAGETDGEAGIDEAAAVAGASTDASGSTRETDAVSSTLSS
jgi:4-amino-4-deoxy-L-arabinose transferase-like glycosyltransferase